MKSYKSLETAAIFYSSEPFVKQGISWVYVMVDFVRMGLQELCRSRVEPELQNVKVLLTVGFEPGTSRLLSECATTELRRLTSTEWIKVHLLFTCAIFRILPVALGRCSKIIFHELHFVNSLLSANFLICKQQNDTNSRWQKKTTTYFATSNTCYK